LVSARVPVEVEPSARDAVMIKDVFVSPGDISGVLRCDLGCWG